jgi:single-strand DNA-binding protein
MAFEVVGRLHRLFATEQKSSSFSTREFVLEIPDGNYPQLIKFQAVQDRCAILDRFSEGDNIKVSFDLRGREWNGKYLTNLNAWRVEAADGSDAGSGGGDNAKAQSGGENFPSDPFPNYTDAPKAQQGGGGGDFGDLPF